MLLRQIYTKDTTREYETCLRATQRKKKELVQLTADQENSSAKLIMLEASVRNAEGVLAKTRANAESEIDAAPKKEKQAVQEEWDAKIAEAERDCLGQQALLQAATQEQERRAPKVTCDVNEWIQTVLIVVWYRLLLQNVLSAMQPIRSNSSWQ